MFRVLIVALLYATDATLASTKDVCKQGEYAQLVPHISKIPEAREFCRIKYPSGSQSGVRSSSLVKRESQDPVWKRVKAKAGTVLSQVCKCIQQTPAEPPSETSPCDSCAKPHNPYCPNGRCKCDFAYKYGRRVDTSGAVKSAEAQQTSLESCARECDNAGNTCVAVEFDCKTKACTLYSKTGPAGSVADTSNRYAVAVKSNCRNKDATCQPPQEQPVCTELQGLPTNFSDTSCSCGYTYSDNTGIDPSTATLVAASNGTLEDCARFCDSAFFRDCEAFTYDCTKPFQGSFANCILYKRSNPMSPVRSMPQTRFVYGMRGTCRDPTCVPDLCPTTSDLPKPAGSCGCEYRYDRNRGINSLGGGDQVTQVSSVSLTACSAACDAQSNCVAADYSCASQTCSLYTGFGDTARFNNNIHITRSGCAATCSNSRAEPTCPSISNPPTTFPDTTCGCTYSYTFGQVIRPGARLANYFSQGTLESCSRAADRDASVVAYEYNCKDQDCIFYSKLPAGEPVRDSSNPNFLFVSRGSCRNAACQNN